MPAYLTTKCPECDGITGHCLDSTLSEPRTEYDGKRCRACCEKARGKKLYGHRLLSNRKTQAKYTYQYGGPFY